MGLGDEQRRRLCLTKGCAEKHIQIMDKRSFFGNVMTVLHPSGLVEQIRGPFEGQNDYRMIGHRAKDRHMIEVDRPCPWPET
jgi:hypothetical protein